MPLNAQSGSADLRVVVPGNHGDRADSLVLLGDLDPIGILRLGPIAHFPCVFVSQGAGRVVRMNSVEGIRGPFAELVTEEYGAAGAFGIDLMDHAQPAIQTKLADRPAIDEDHGFVFHSKPSRMARVPIQKVDDVIGGRYFASVLSGASRCDS